MSGGVMISPLGWRCWGYDSKLRKCLFVDEIQDFPNEVSIRKLRIGL